MADDLQGKAIVITGASSGAGRAAAMEFAKHKTHLVLAARNTEALEQLATECRRLGSAAIVITTDVNDIQAVKRLANSAYDSCGKIDVWINNAGVLAAGEFTKTPIEIHHKVIQTNLIGYLNGAYAVLPYFKKQKSGILINNISIGAWLPVPYGVGYSASKFGLRGFSEALRGELIKWPQIHICDLFPAFLDTPGIQHAANYTGSALRPAPPVYDPQRLARTMVRTALYPRSNTTMGSVAYLLRFAHFFAPGITRFCTAKLMELYFKKAAAIKTSDGNLFAPVTYGTSIHGGWNTSEDASKRNSVVIRAAILAGLIVGLSIPIKRMLKN
jgi:short-subunit dehydrogenase